MSFLIDKINTINNYGFSNTINAAEVKNSDSSIFITAAKTEKNNNDKNTNSNNMQKVNNLQKQIAGNIVPTKLTKEAKQINDKLEKSKVPNMTLIGKFIKDSIENICAGVGEIAEKASNIKVDGKTEEEIDSEISRLKEELDALTAKAKAIVARGNKAVELDGKLTPILNSSDDGNSTDTRIKNVMDKVYKGITEDINMESISGENSTGKNESSNNTGYLTKGGSTTEDIENNDEITKDMKELIDALNNKEKTNTKSNSSNELIAAFFPKEEKSDINTQNLFKDSKLIFEDKNKKQRNIFSF